MNESKGFKGNDSKGFKMKSLQDLLVKTAKPAPLTKQASAKPLPKAKRQPTKAQQQQQTKPKKPYKKQKISAALREQVWVQNVGDVFETKCTVTWCHNKINVFNFQCGHDIPESKGGPTDITNLYPICGKCNLSMSNLYTFKEWCKLYEGKQEVAVEVPEPQEPLPKRSFWRRMVCCFR